MIILASLWFVLIQFLSSSVVVVILLLSIVAYVAR